MTQPWEADEVVTDVKPWEKDAVVAKSSRISTMAAPQTDAKPQPSFLDRIKAAVVVPEDKREKPTATVSEGLGRAFGDIGKSMDKEGGENLHALEGSVTRPIDGFEDYMKRPFEVAGNALGYLASPITGAAKSIVGRPVELATGIDRNITGNVASAFIPLGGEAEAASKVNSLRSVTRPSEAAAEVLKRLRQGEAGGGPTAQDMLNLARSAPHKPLTLMDLGSQSVTALGGRMARTPGTSAQMMRDFLGDRTANQGRRLSADVSQSVSPASAHPAIEAMQEARATAAKPLYDQAYKANQNMQSPAIDKILTTPAGRTALAQARVKMQNDMTLMARPDADLAEQIKESGQKMPFSGGAASGLKLRTLDYVKRSMDDMIGAAKRAGENDNARILTGLKGNFVSEMDKADVTGRAGSNSLKPEGGLYKQARAAYSGPSQSMEAVEFGQNALKPGSSIEENSTQFAKLNPNDQEFARIGLASAVRDMIGRKDIGTNAARTLARNPAVQARIRPFFRGDSEYGKFMNSVLAEDAMFKTGTSVLGGSQTAERVAEDIMPHAEIVSHAANAANHLRKGNLVGAGWNAMRAFGEYARRPNPELAKQITEILTSPLSEENGRGMELLNSFAKTAPKTRALLTGSNPLPTLARGAPAVNALRQLTQQPAEQ